MTGVGVSIRRKTPTPTVRLHTTGAKRVAYDRLRWRDIVARCSNENWGTSLSLSSSEAT